jgi:hypothetical protein
MKRLLLIPLLLLISSDSSAWIMSRSIGENLKRSMVSYYSLTQAPGEPTVITSLRAEEIK